MTTTTTNGRSGPVALRLPLDPGPLLDPFALAGATGILFHAAGRALVGLGTALTIALPHGLDSDADLRAATQTLASIPCDDRLDAPSGAGAPTAALIAFATLLFDRSAPATLVVPEITFGSDETGREWVTLVTSDRAALPSGSGGLRSWLAAGTAGAGDGVRAGTPVDVTLPSSDDSFVAMVAGALGVIDRGKLLKVVLSRSADVTLDEAIDVPDLLRRWRDLEPNCGVFSLPTPAGQFVGASPELLVKRTGPQILSRPLAGTAERHGSGTRPGPRPDALLDSSKDSAEHRFVVRAIDQVLRPLCSQLDVPAQPDLVLLHNIVHLGTPVRGTLAERPDGSVPDALELVGALHPTPAVGGVPTREALDLIGQLEPEPRGHYAGPVGYVDSRGDGRWMVGIRSLTVSGHVARLNAGVGIVAGSDPQSELAETDLKLAAVLDALAPARPTGRLQASSRTSALR
jgi:menaquinone-specific isochorismate synthase